MKRIFLLFISTAILFCIKINAQNKDDIYYLRRCPYLSPSIEKLIGTDVSDSLATENLKNIIVCRGGNSVRINTSLASSLSLGLLKMINNSDLIAVIFSVNTPNESSSITFFSNEFVPLRSGSFISPTITKEMFIPKNTDTNLRIRLMQLLSPLHLVYKFQNSATLLTATAKVKFTEEDKTNKDLVNMVDHFPIITYKWNGMQYVLDTKTHK